jgi:hypothetical protein
LFYNSWQDTFFRSHNPLGAREKLNKYQE